MSDMRRVVITGMGMVSPLGAGVDHNWNAITNGKSGIRKIEHFEVSDIASQIAGIIPKNEDENPTDGAFNANLFMEPKDQRKTDIFIVYGMAAAQEAIEDSGWAPTDQESLERTGVLIGSGIGGLDTIHKTSVLMEQKGPRRVSPFLCTGLLD